VRKASMKILRGAYPEIAEIALESTTGFKIVLAISDDTRNEGQYDIDCKLYAKNNFTGLQSQRSIEKNSANGVNMIRYLLRSFGDCERKLDQRSERSPELLAANRREIFPADIQAYFR